MGVVLTFCSSVPPASRCMCYLWVTLAIARTSERNRPWQGAFRATIVGNQVIKCTFQNWSYQSACTSMKVLEPMKARC